MHSLLNYLKTFIKNSLTSFDEKTIETLNQKYPSQKDDFLRLVHNEVLNDCNEYIRSLINKKEVKIISLGCGFNYNLNYCGSEQDKRLGIDLLPPPPKEEFSIMQKYFKPYTADYLQIDIDEFYTDEKYELVIASEVLEHVLSPTQLIKKISNLLTDDGFAVISYPNMLFWKERLNFFLYGKFNNYQKNDYRYGHTNIFTKENFLTLLNLEGLEVYKRWPSFSFYYPKISVVQYSKNYSDFFDYGVIWIVKKKL